MRSIVLLFIFSVATAYAQKATLQGSVRSENSKLLSQVTLQLIGNEGFEATTTSDKQGMYRFTDIPYGVYTLMFSRGDFSDFLAIQLNQTNNRQDIFITQGDVVLDNIQIHAQSQKDKIETRGFAVNVINTERMSLQSIQTTELLDRSAGVKIRQDGGLGSQVNYNINGLSGKSVKIFINGLPADSYGRSFSLNSIPPSSIERIEVYKGVVPANLSQDALGGAINIILKQKRENALVVSNSIGSFNTYQWNVNGSYRAKTGFTVNGTGFHSYSDNNYRVKGPQIKFKDNRGQINYPTNGALRFHDAFKSSGAKFDLGYTDVSWADQFFVGAIFSRSMKEIQHGVTMDKVYGDRYTTHKSELINLNYLKRDAGVKGLTFKVDASYGNLGRQIVDTVGNMYDWSGKKLVDANGNTIKYNSGSEVSSAKSLQLNSDRTFAVRSNVSYAINHNNTLHINHFYNSFKRAVSDELQPIGLQLLVNTRDLQKNIFAFSYENTAFYDRLKTNVFFKRYQQRVQSNEPFRDGATPLVGDLYKLKTIEKNVNFDGYGLALSLRIMPKIYLLTSAEKAIRLPSENELFGSNADNLLPAFELKPETSDNINLGVNFGPYITGSHSIAVNTSFFYRNTQGMIREGIDPSNVFTKYENLESVLSKGFDAELNYSYQDNFTLSFNVSKFDVLFNTPFDRRGQAYLFYKTQIRNEPSLKFNANLGYTFYGLFAKEAATTIYYNLYYVKGFNRDWANVGAKNLDLVPTQYPNDLGMAYVLPNKKTSVSLDAKNIFNQQIFDNFGLQKPGRAFYAKITHFF